MQETILIIVSIVAIVVGLYLLSRMPSDIMKNMSNECSEYIKEQDRKFEEKQLFYKELRRWWFR